jgi:hypothetical protein
MTAKSDPAARVDFGRFAVHPLRRELFADGVPIELCGRAFDVPRQSLSGCVVCR